MRQIISQALRPEHQKLWLSSLGASLGIAFVSLICGLIHKLSGYQPLLMAPIGASAAIVFVVPNGPFSTPKSVILGNGLCALCAISVGLLFPDPLIGAALAVGLSIGLMQVTKSFHPAGGGVALLVILTKTHDYGFVIWPCMLNSALLCGFAYVYHRLLMPRLGLKTSV